MENTTNNDQNPSPKDSQADSANPEVNNDEMIWLDSHIDFRRLLIDSESEAYYKVGPYEYYQKKKSEIDEEDKQKNKNIRDIILRETRKWVSSLIQSEHLSLLVGNGLTIAATEDTKNDRDTKDAKDLTNPINWCDNEAIGDCDLAETIETYLKSKNEGKTLNIEDSLQAAITLLEGLRVMEWQNQDRCNKLKESIEVEINKLITEIIEVENKSKDSMRKLMGFLLAFINRTANRDRLNIFTTNYDRFIEYGCDKLGIRIIDRFVGSIEPRFNATRMNVDLHYNPPGLNQEPRYMEGIVRLTKLHGSLDWEEDDSGNIIKKPIAFGEDRRDSKSRKIIYPNPAKDMDSTHYPYSELFRDFAAAICRPNSTLVIYGYGFGDEHINRIIQDMLNIQSTHLLIIHYGIGEGEAEKLNNFLSKDGVSSHLNQISLMVGEDLADIKQLVRYYLPNIPLDAITGRVSKNEKDQERINSGNNGGGVD